MATVKDAIRVTNETTHIQSAVRPRPSREEAERAVRTLLRWAGDDPDREGLRDTPKRYVAAFEEWFAGYSADPTETLSRTFEEVEGYDEMVVLRNIRFESHCEHHIAPIVGKAQIGFDHGHQPDDRRVSRKRYDTT